MIRPTWLVILVLPLVGCEHSKGVLISMDSSGASDGSSGSGSCTTPPWVFPDLGSEPSWVTNSCPPVGCPSGTTCVKAGEAALIVSVGCAPVPAACSGTPTCGCMGCVCGGSSTCMAGSGGIMCDTPTASRRSTKADIVYVQDHERAALARMALEMPLARYRYKDEPSDARRRLGFIIDDQPDPSPAVLADRAHVDQYGYTSMLLATIQQQSKELAELRQRIERLEQAR